MKYSARNKPMSKSKRLSKEELSKLMSALAFHRHAGQTKAERKAEIERLNAARIAKRALKKAPPSGENPLYSP